MTEFVLKTETERHLYAEAILVCLDRGTLSDAEAERDLKDMIFASASPNTRQDTERRLSNRILDILKAYRQGVIDQSTATGNFEALLSTAAETSDQVEA